MASIAIRLYGTKTLERVSAFVLWLAGLAIACALLASACAHLQNPYRFLDSIYKYELVPRTVAELLAAVLPFVHLTIALCLIAGIWRRAAFGAGYFLFVVYTMAQVAVLARRMNVDCGCFGPSATARPVGAASVTLAAGASLVCLLGWWISGQKQGASASVPVM